MLFKTWERLAGLLPKHYEKSISSVSYAILTVLSNFITIIELVELVARSRSSHCLYTATKTLHVVAATVHSPD